MSSLIIETIKNQLNNVEVLNKRIENLAGVDKDLKPLQQKVLHTDFDLRMHIASWEKLFSSPNAMNAIKTHNLTGEQVTMLLHYTYLNDISEKEWQVLSDRREIVFEKMAKYQDAYSFIKDFTVPLVLDFVKNKRSEEDFSVQDDKFKAYFDYRTNAKKWCHHEVIQRMIDMIYTTDIQISLIEHMAEKQNVHTEEGRKEFMHFTDYVLKYKDRLSIKDDLIHFMEGYCYILRAGSIELVDEIQKARGERFSNDLIQLGKNIFVDIPERVLKRLLHKEEEVLSVLFHPHGEWMKEEIDLYHYRVKNRIEYSEWERAKAKLQFVQKIIMDNKKAFIKLYQEQVEELALKDNYQGGVALFQPKFYEVVNVNTLNKMTLKKALEIKLNEGAFKELNEVITFQEFEFMNEAGVIQNQLYRMMNDWKIDDKIRVLRTLPNIQGFKGYRFSEEAFVDALLKSMKEKEFTHYTQYMKSRDISKKGALFIHLFKHEFIHVLEEIQTDIDVELLMKHKIRKEETLLEMKTRLYQNLPDINAFAKFLGASPQFIQNNKKSYYEFYEKGLMNVVMTYKGSLNENQKNNLRLLAKAEIANKLKEVKYRDEDFAKEIGIAVESKNRVLWKEDNQKQKGKFTFKETSEFNHLIRMGEIPTRTCMNWSDGSYRECLLSIFDLNKKMLVAEKEGKVTARAILRLTKVNEQATDIEKELNFLDVEKVNVDEVKAEGVFKGERLVLFLERLYTSFTGNERDLIEREIITLVQEKAKEMGVELFLATTYQADKVEKEVVKVPMFISRSKNGNQYLDSLGGSSDESEGGKYHKSSVYKITQ